MKNILFVDDEAMVLDGLHRMLRAMRHEWQMTFASSGPEALEILEKGSFDVIVTDMRMPGMDGGQLLNEVKERHPNVVRIILSGHSAKEKILHSIGPVHQYLSKPCDAEALKSTVSRACAMRHLLNSDSLISLVSAIESLPSLPSLYAEIMEEMNSQESSISRVGEIISKDVAMSAKVLQLVNSSFFGHPVHVSNPSRAAALIGLETLKALVLGVKIFSEFSGSDFPGYCTIANLWEHSVATGFLAKDTAESLGREQAEIDDCFLAGLMHDLGKLILLEKLPSACEEIVEDAAATGSSLIKAEQEALGTTHAQVGAYLLGIWGFSESIVDAIAFHHQPGEYANGNLTTLTIVHLANGLEHRNNPANLNDAWNFDLEYLSKVGMIDRIAGLQLGSYCRATGGETNACKNSLR
jgi:putative nucleotidyltransferase with HDIG domain